MRYGTCTFGEKCRHSHVQLDNGQRPNPNSQRPYPGDSNMRSTSVQRPYQGNSTMLSNSARYPGKPPCFRFANTGECYRSNCYFDHVPPGDHVNHQGVLRPIQHQPAPMPEPPIQQLALGFTPAHVTALPQVDPEILFNHMKALQASLFPSALIVVKDEECPE